MSGPQKWRFRDDGAAPGLQNMEEDRGLFESFVPERDLPVFRFYRWSPPAISLGRFQAAEKVLDLARCREDNLAVVRRITGGGAILHDDELTYSLVCSREDIGGGNVKESYRRLCAFILEAYRSLGLNAAFARDAGLPRSVLGEKNPVCFAGLELFDVTVDGRKIGGNAQRRRRGVIFQHGSIPLRLNPERSRRYFLPSPAAAGAPAAGLKEFLPELDLACLQHVLRASLCRTLGIELSPLTSGGGDAG